MNFQEAVRKAASLLRDTSETPRLDAEILLAFVTGEDRLRFITDPATPLSPEAEAALFELVARRAQHEPVAYLLGKKEFYGRDFMVSPHVLIPRPETEILIEEALKIIDDHKIDRVLDLGTGSGCIALTLAAERPGLNVVATDISELALTVARGNAKCLGVDAQLTFYCGNWFEALPESEAFQLIVSNPPYVSRDEEVYEGAHYEPASALYADRGGRADVAYLLQSAREFAKNGASMLIEIGETQAESYLQNLPLHCSAPSILKDYSGKDRFLRVTIEY